MREKRILISSVVAALLVSFPFLTHSISAKADDLVIQDDGKIVLIITNSGVLGVSTKEEPKKSAPAAPGQTKPPEKHESEKHENENKPAPPGKVVPLVPAHTESTVHIDPPINNDKKIQVTITTTPQSAPAERAKPPTQQTTNTNVAAHSSNTVITKTVDQVVAQGANGEAVFRITSNEANHLTIRQETTEVSTRLPLQINTLTHDLSVSLGPNESAQISVLPKEALKGVENKGLLNNTNRDQTKITLTKSIQGVNYTIQNEKKGKLFGTFDVKVPVAVQLSAQNGRVITTPQSLFFTFFNRLIQ